MDLRQIPFFAAVHQRLDWLQQRQEVLAQNVANSDTPGYRPHDLKPLSFREMIDRPESRLQVASTQAGHLAGTHENGPFRTVESRRTFETAPDGNAVVLEEQLAKANQTQIGHKLITELYRKHLGLFRVAMGGQ